MFTVCTNKRGSKIKEKSFPWNLDLSLTGLSSGLQKLFTDSSFRSLILSWCNKFDKL